MLSCCPQGRWSGRLWFLRVPGHPWLLGFLAVSTRVRTGLVLPVVLRVQGGAPEGL